MYERFTDRSRKVMQLANQEAQRFNHEYVGTEHLLLGLIKEGAGVAAAALANLGIDLRKIRLEVEKLVQSGPDTVVNLGKLPQTPRTNKVIEFAIEAAREMGDNHVGTEHLLIGLLREKGGTAYTVLSNLGVEEKVLNEVLMLLGDSAMKNKCENPVASQDLLCSAALWEIQRIMQNRSLGSQRAIEYITEICDGLKQ